LSRPTPSLPILLVEPCASYNAFEIGFSRHILLPAAKARCAAMIAGKVGTIKQQELMREEQAGGYHLAVLHVDTTTASYSETGLEEE
jgi:hypothetical protein